MEQDDLHNLFNQKVAQFSQKLEEKYHAVVAKADNREYAEAYFRATLFKHNKLLPSQSYFFDKLCRVFLHNYHISREDALLKTFDHVYELKIQAEQELNGTLELIEKNHLEEDDALVLNLEQEWKLICCEYHELVEYLALFIATRALLEKYPEKKETILDIYAPLKFGASKRPQHTVTFTQRQQLLALYFLLYQEDVRLGVQYDKTNFARMAHLLTKHPITNLSNTGVYKSTKQLFDQKWNAQNLKDLKIILPYFRDLGFEKAIIHIEKEIEVIQEQIDSK